MSEKDATLIAKARAISYVNWYMIDDLIEQAETEETRETLRSIRSSKYHTEEYYSGCL